MATDTTTEPHSQGRGPTDRGASRPWHLIGAVVATLAVVGLVLLFGGGSNEPAKPAGTETLAFVDGTLVVVEQDRLVMKPFEPVDGRDEVSFVVRPEDAANFDLAHLQSHSSVAIPTRIYYRRDGDTFYAIYKEDAPVNTQTP